MAKLKPYPKYKDSGVEWLGLIPEGWEVKPGRTYLRENKTKNDKLQEAQVLSLSYGRIIKKNKEDLHGLVPESFETYQIIEPGDLIIRSMDLQNDKVSLRVGLVRDKGIITSAYLCLKTDGKVMPDFAYYLLHTYDIQKVFYSLGSGLRQNLSYVDFKYLPVVRPSFKEQSQIVTFIDHKSSQIDTYIKKLQKEIELLKEYRQKIISQAVTCGLDEDGKLRRKPKWKPGDPIPQGWQDSGVEWLGLIPEGWEITPLRSLFKEKSNKGFPEETLLSVYRDYGVIEKDSRDDNHNVAGQDLDNYKLVEVGDLVVNKMKTWQGSLGISKYRGIVSPAYITAKPITEFSSEYINTLLRSSNYVFEYNRLSYGVRVGQWDIHYEDFKKIPVILPSFEAQQQIATYLNNKTSQIDKQIEKIHQQNEFVKEYKQSLISKVVTGKLDVRGIS